jgi:hypothetical protein
MGGHSLCPVRVVEYRTTPTESGQVLAAGAPKAAQLVASLRRNGVGEDGSRVRAPGIHLLYAVLRRPATQSSAPSIGII